MLATLLLLGPAAAAGVMALMGNRAEARRLSGEQGRRG